MIMNSSDEREELPLNEPIVELKTVQPSLLTNIMRMVFKPEPVMRQIDDANCTMQTLTNHLKEFQRDLAGRHLYAWHNIFIRGLSSSNLEAKNQSLYCGEFTRPGFRMMNPITQRGVYIYHIDHRPPSFDNGWSFGQSYVIRQNTLDCIDQRPKCMFKVLILPTTYFEKLNENTKNKIQVYEELNILFDTVLIMDYHHAVIAFLCK